MSDAAPYMCEYLGGITSAVLRTDRPREPQGVIRGIHEEETLMCITNFFFAVVTACLVVIPNHVVYPHKYDIDCVVEILF